MSAWIPLLIGYALAGTICAFAWIRGFRLALAAGVLGEGALRSRSPDAAEIRKRPRLFYGIIVAIVILISLFWPIYMIVESIRLDEKD